jgi:NAD(P)-dependent dehydrogenase (short-subunit alcohol dehydrogenase family)
VALRGKVAIVTGGSRGMGRVFVDALVDAGVAVACLARPSPELDAVAAEHGTAVAAIPCDMSRAEMIDAAVAATIERFGRLDIVIHNAAIFQPFRVEVARAEQIKAHIDVNLVGPMWLSRAAIPHLKATRGQIVAISSESVRLPFPFLTVYAATKAGLETFCAGLRDELREDGVRVSVLRSGSVRGGSGDRDWDPDVTQQFFATIQRTGHASFTGDAADPRSMAATLLAVLTLPADVSIDLIEARGAVALNSKSPASGPVRGVQA